MPGGITRGAENKIMGMTDISPALVKFQSCRTDNILRRLDFYLEISLFI